MTDVHTILSTMRRQFKDAGLDTPELDARLLVQGILGLRHEDILLHPKKEIGVEEGRKLSEAMARRLKHEPVARILGARSFWKSDFKVSPETLDPRPDSETLIEAVLKYTEKGQPLTILDLGTGTGCLLLSLLQELPQATGVGVDISAGAAETARQNAEALGLSVRASFITSDWEDFAPARPFDIVISNPPYIVDAEIANLEPEVRDYDPARALAGGADGLDCYRSITGLLPRFLSPQGKVFLEVGHDQAEAVKGVLAAAGYPVLQIVADLAGHSRCVVAQRIA